MTLGVTVLDGGGYLLGDTNVLPPAGTVNHPLVLVYSQKGTTTLVPPSDNHGNVWRLMVRDTDGSDQIELWICDQRQAIVPVNGDYISLTGDATNPILWGLWQLDDCDPFWTGTAVGAPTWIANPEIKTTITGRPGALVLGASIGIRGSTNGSGWLAQWNSTSGADIAGSHIEVDDPADPGLAAMRASAKILTGASATSYEQILQGAGLSGVSGSGVAARITPWRTTDAKRPPARIQAVNRSGRY